MNDALPAGPADNERDAWLREALRHAPDATAAPPRGLSDAILREAYSAAAPARQVATRRRPWWQGLADFWASLGRGRMATSFAGVLAAVLVGLMWWDQPMDEAMPRPPAPSPTATTTAVPAPPAADLPRAETAPGGAEAAREPRATLPAEPAAQTQRPAKVNNRLDADSTQAQLKDAPKMKADTAAPSAFPADEKARRRPSEEAAAPVLQGKSEDAQPLALRKAAAPTAAAPAPEALARSTDNEAAPTDALRQRDKALPPAPAPPPAFAPAFTPAPAAPAAPAPILNEAKEAKAEATREQRSSMRVAPASVTSAAMPPAASLFAGNAARQRLDAAVPAQPLRSLLERLAAEAPAWRRQAAGGGEMALDAAVRDWLASIDAAASGWTVVEPTVADQRAAIGRVEESGRSEVRLLHDGRLAAVVRVEAGAVVIETQGEGPPRTWRAALPAERAARLRASLPASPR